jgi:2-haloacid dehalogenase
MDLRSFDALTFDCYGTLIDWETGITHALGFLAARAGRDPTELVELFGEIEREAESGPYRPYREVLADVSCAIAARFGISLEPGEETLLGESVGDWPAHPDTQGAMRALKERSRLGILSNVDHDLFEGTRPKLGVELDVVVTAEDVRGYKPGLAHFERGLEALGLPAGRVLHVAESRFHDVEPANRMGIAVVHVDRSGGAGATASGAGGGTPDLTVHTLAELVDLIQGAATT